MLVVTHYFSSFIQLCIIRCHYSRLPLLNLIIHSCSFFTQNSANPFNLLLITPKISQAIYSYREFIKRMDGDLPFYYWTLDERYSHQNLPSFDHCPTIDEDQDLRTHPLRLHRLRINQREDSSIFVSGRAHLPSRHKKSMRQSFHKPESILPDPL